MVASRWRPLAVGLTLCFGLAACNGATTSLPSDPQTQGSARSRAHRGSTTSSPIQHVIIVIQENRTFNNLFATFPGAKGATSGYYLKGEGKKRIKTPIALKESVLPAPNYNHGSEAYNYDCDGEDTYPKTSCAMDGFNLEGVNGNNAAGVGAYQYVNPTYIQPYWTIAQQYGLADKMFQTQGSASFTAHQDLVHGGTAIVDTNCGSSEPACSLIDLPDENKNWGCGAKPNVVTDLLTTSGKDEPLEGPFPCLTYPDKTMVDLLDGAGVSWKYYTPAYESGTAGAEWDAMAALKNVYGGPDWKNNVSIPQTNVYKDISGGTLPAVSWVIPTQDDSDHPHGPKAVDDGPDWIASIVNAVGQSSYWNSTAIIVTWDDWGGFYDPVPPAFFDNQGGLGFRVPMLVVSPYVKQGTISHTQYEFASILKFVEDNFNLGRMGTPSFPNNDARATSMADMFDFSMQPRLFTVIPSVLKKSHFVHEKPSYELLDDDDD